MTNKTDSVGIVEPHDFVLQEGIRLHSGQILAPVILRYETYGTLSEKRTMPFLLNMPSPEMLMQPVIMPKAMADPAGGTA